MIFSLYLKIEHPSLDEPIERNDMMKAVSLSSALKQIKLATRNICDLRNTGRTSWMDEHGGTCTLEIKEETNH